MEQLIAKKVGADGCYYFCILYIAGVITKKTIDAIQFFKKATTSKTDGIIWVDENDCYLNYPEAMLKHLIDNNSVALRKEVADYQPKDDEVEITLFENKETGKTYYHFVVTRNNVVVYDPFGKSNTVRKGTPYSKRIIKIKDFNVNDFEGLCA